MSVHYYGDLIYHIKFGLHPSLDEDMKPRGKIGYMCSVFKEDKPTVPLTRQFSATSAKEAFRKVRRHFRTIESSTNFFDSLIECNVDRPCSLNDVSSSQ